MKDRRKRKKSRVSLYGRPKSKNQMEVDESRKVEKRGDVEKRHHSERKLLQKEERLIRQKMRRLNKRIPEQAQERKALLLKIKDSEKELKERQKKELEAFSKDDMKVEEQEEKSVVALKQLLANKSKKKKSINLADYQKLA
mmetsp:Transcript_12532/g.14381  ORF Transcript_12532/g.14381 Transcript_12532/m.14381 type:complete len:141 (-) Transcript_12532:573-995(-)